MSALFDKLNLRPNERRLVVIVGVIIFLVVNFVFVWPQRNDWKRAQKELADDRQTLERFREAIAKEDEYEKELQSLEGKGSAVLPKEAATRLLSTVQTQAAANNVNITGTRPLPRTRGGEENEFFEEHAYSISVVTGDEELVNFLVALSTGDSVIRVRDMSLKPDNSQTRLEGNLTLVASYQKGSASNLANENQSTRVRRDRRL